MTTESLVLLGGGGHASDVLAVWEALNPNDPRPVTIFDDGDPRTDRFASRRVELVRDLSLTPVGSRFVAAVGYPGTRERLVVRAQQALLEPSEALIDPDARVSAGAQVGLGAVLSGASWISPMVLIGCHTYVGYGAKVGHDTSIGDFASLFPGSFVAGDCQIGRSVVVGANATILEGLSVGDGAVVGAGAVVTGDVDEGATVTGVPAASSRGRAGGRGR